MELLLVTEVCYDNNMLINSWVCSTEEEAKECLQWRYNLACAINRLLGVDDPANCLDSDFFIWKNMNRKYNIERTQTFQEKSLSLQK